MIFLTLLLLIVDVHVQRDEVHVVLAANVLAGNGVLHATDALLGREIRDQRSSSRNQRPKIKDQLLTIQVRQGADLGELGEELLERRQLRVRALDELLCLRKVGNNDFLFDKQTQTRTLFALSQALSLAHETYPFEA